MAKAKDIRIDQMVSIKAATDNQKRAFQEYQNGKNPSCLKGWQVPDE